MTSITPDYKMDTYRAAIKNAQQFDPGICRRPCPRCNLETIVRRKQMSKPVSGLHVICYQCQLDWCFICNILWHAGEACKALSLNLSSPDEGNEHSGIKTLEDIDCNDVQTQFESFNYEELLIIPEDPSRNRSTGIPNIVAQSLSVSYTNKVEDETCVILNTETTCHICYSNVANDIRSCCPLPICTDCFRTYLTLKITDGIIEITCPNHDCSHMTSEEEIKGSVDGNTFLKYQQFVVNAKQEPHRKTCPRCNYITVIDLHVGLSNGSKDGLRISCPECDLSWCFNCRVPWHRDITCAEYQSRDDNAFTKWALEYSSGQINARKCPTCQVYIQRNGGCDHINCTQCGTDFCYQCGERGTNHGHTERNRIDVEADNLRPRIETHPLSVRAKIRKIVAIVVIILISITPFLVCLLVPLLATSPSSGGSRTTPSSQIIEYYGRR